MAGTQLLTRCAAAPLTHTEAEPAAHFTRDFLAANRIQLRYLKRTLP